MAISGGLTDGRPIHHHPKIMPALQYLFLDLDGVLADFMTSALALHQCLDRLRDWPPGEFHVHTVLGISRGEFWRVIDAAGACFWEELPAFPWMHELLDLLRRFAPITIASSPNLDPGCLAGKVAWMQRHFGREFRDYLIGEPKHLLAGPGRVLIDDRDRNVRKFREHGGAAILFPQPWNANHAIQDRLRYVEEELRRLVE